MYSFLYTFAKRLTIHGTDRLATKSLGKITLAKDLIGGVDPEASDIPTASTSNAPPIIQKLELSSFASILGAPEQAIQSTPLLTQVIICKFMYVTRNIFVF